MIASGIDFVPLTHAWLAALFRASWQGAIAVGLVWCLCRMVPRIPPAVRCWLWRLVLLKFLLLVVWPATIDLPWLPADGLWGKRVRQETQQPLAAGDNRSFPGTVPTGGEDDLAADSAPPAAAKAGVITVGSILWAVWALGVSIVAVVLFVRSRAARRWRKRCTLVKDADILTVCERLADELGVYQPPVLFISEACESPVVFGALRTSVVLPADLVDATDPKRLRLILCHELAHIRRGDLVWNWVATAVWGLFFFHPLVWLALRELRLNQELACDACAIESRDASRADYGALLVELAGQTKAPSNMLVTVGVVESFEFLKRRLKAMKDFGDRSAWGKSVSILLLSLAVIGLLPWRLVAHAPEPESGRFLTSPAANALEAVDDVGRPALATILVEDLEVAVNGLRWAAGSGYQLIETGLPYDNGAGSNGLGRSGGFAGALDGPTLIVDLRVGRPSDKSARLLCAVIGRVQAQDDRGNVLDAPDLPAFLKMELQGADYPRGIGCTAVHLNPRD
ncbi:MAG: M56 family metallopeptidase, partial [Planctomycetes bacterium]|nr:M56 family metallopeptidase [Planctomycetota bacterium]